MYTAAYFNLIFISVIFLIFAANKFYSGETNVCIYFNFGYYNVQGTILSDL